MPNHLALTCLYLSRYSESIWFEHMKVLPLTSLKLAALNHSANSLFFGILILQWLEHWTYPYQEHTLPVKLKNLQPAVLYLNLFFLITLVYNKRSIHTIYIIFKYIYIYIYIYLDTRVLRLELRNIRLKLTVLPIKLHSSEKRWIEHLRVKHNI